MLRSMSPHFKHTILSIAGVKYRLFLPSMCNVTLLLSILHIKSSLRVLKNGSCSKIFAVFYGVHTMYFSHSLNYFARKFFNVIKELAGFNDMRHVLSLSLLVQHTSAPFLVYFETNSAVFSLLRSNFLVQMLQCKESLKYGFYK